MLWTQNADMFGAPSPKWALSSALRTPELARVFLHPTDLHNNKIDVFSTNFAKTGRHAGKIH
jgi:hypothetical protein